MSNPSRPFDFSHLSPADRILLAEDLWDSVTVQQDAPPLSPAQKEELRSRIAAADRGETTYSSWQEVKRRLTRPK
jgi:putative addiction module component (TIGR02574 family)